MQQVKHVKLNKWCNRLWLALLELPEVGTVCPGMACDLLAVPLVAGLMTALGLGGEGRWVLVGLGNGVGSCCTTAPLLTECSLSSMVTCNNRYKPIPRSGTGTIQRDSCNDA